MTLSDDAATLRFLQQYVKQIETERGHISDNLLTKAFLLGEEIGELFKALREYMKMKLHNKTERFSVAEELGDCLFYIIAIANRCNVDLFTALMNKIKKDADKTYYIPTGKTE